MSHEIKKRNKERFNEWSKVYDKSILQRIVFNISHDMFFKEILHFLKGGFKVLDVGCGTGKFAHSLYEFDSELTIDGVDLSEEMIEKAKEKLNDEPITFKVGDVENLPYESDTFDAITCSHSFHHYPDQKKALSEMHRVLKNNGILMIVDGSRDTLFGNIIFGIVEIIERKVYHIFEKELKQMFRLVGFDRIIQKRFNPIAPLLFTLGRARKKGGTK